MIFKYASPEFKELKANICKVFANNMNQPSLSQGNIILIRFFLILFNEENTINLNKLDDITLTFNSWDNPNDPLNNNTLSKQNTRLLDLSNQNVLENLPSSLEVYIESLYLVVYADFYEASLVTSERKSKDFFEVVVSKLQEHTDSLSEAALKKLHNLWFEIPRNVFAIHLKQNLSDRTLETVKHLQTNEDHVSKQLVTSEKLQKKVEEIQKSLEDQKSEYNFVGLSNGFRTLREQKKKELDWQNRAYYALMAIIILLIISKSVWSANYLVSNNFDSPVFIIVTISTVLFLFILLYFFRISLVNVKSVKSQILQIDLRLTLCQFIHNYDSDTKDLREGMKESFERFESVIFAPIVATEDQMPSTFDGIEQLTGMIGLFNKKSD